MNILQRSNLSLACLHSDTKLWIFLLLLALPIAGLAQDFTYAINGDAITITGYTGTGGTVTIPSTINGLPVTAIGNSAFAGLTNVTGVTIPDSVTIIGNSAFARCGWADTPYWTSPTGAFVHGLASLAFGNNVSVIGDGAFAGCCALTNVTIPDSVTSIGNQAFAGCSGPSGSFDLMAWQLSDFYSHGLTNVSIGNGVTNIGDEAFTGCTCLSSVTIGKNVTHIGTKAFFGCYNLAGVTIPDSVTIIDNSAFADCGCSGSQNWGMISTAYTHGLGSLTLGNHVTVIGDGAFAGCCALTSLTIPDSVTSIGSQAFAWCGGLLFAMPSTTIREFFIFGVTSVTIGSSVTNIGDEAFSGCVNLMTVRIPDSVVRIGDRAFAGCGTTACNSWGDQNGIRYGPSYTFGLMNIAIPNGTRSVGIGAFSGCINLTNVIIGSGVTNIGADAFQNCTNLAAITVDALNPAYETVDGVLFDKPPTVLIQYPARKVASDWAIPDSVTNIADYAFAYATNLQRLLFLGDAPNLGASVFAGDYRTTVYYLSDTKGWGGTYGGLQTSSWEPFFVPPTYTINGNTVTITRYIGPGGAVTIPYEIAGLPVTGLADGAFAGCSNVTALYFEGNAPNLGTNVFSGDTTTVYYLPGTTGWEPTLGGLPTALWPLPSPSIVDKGPSFGLRTNGFGFNCWATNLTAIVVEACTNLTNPVWKPLQSGTLTNGQMCFSDPDWTNRPARFYRLRSP